MDYMARTRRNIVLPCDDGRVAPVTLRFWASSSAAQRTAVQRRRLKTSLLKLATCLSVPSGRDGNTLRGNDEGRAVGKVAALARNRPQPEMQSVQYQQKFCRTREKCAVPNQSDSTLGSFFNRVNGATRLSAPP